MTHEHAPMIESNLTAFNVSPQPAARGTDAEPKRTGMNPDRNRLTIAVPCENGRLHGHFGGCREFALVEVDADQKTMLHAELVPAPEHQPGAFPSWLRERGVQVVIAGGIGHRALANFAHHGITVRAGTAGATIEALVTAYLSGLLNTAPDGCNHHGHHHPHGHTHDHEHGEFGEGCH